MNYIENKPEPEIKIMIDTIESKLSESDYKSAFILFLLYIAKLSEEDRDGFIIHFHKYLRRKFA